MNKNLIFGIIGAVVVILSIVAVFESFDFKSNTANISTVNMKTNVAEKINQATYYTINNATTPSIAIDKNSGIITLIHSMNMPIFFLILF